MQTPQGNLTRLTAVTRAWENMRAAKSFSGMTLEQYKQTVQPSLVARAKIADLEAQLVVARAARDEADSVSMAVTRRVIDSVLGDRQEGPDSAFYSAMGFVRKSELRRGLVRRVGRRGARKT
jgi:hypothetical protein